MSESNVVVFQASNTPSSEVGEPTPVLVDPSDHSTLALTAAKGRRAKPGPKSAPGKQKSARNAFKSGFFSRGMLPWEDAKQQQAQWHALVAYWGANDPARVGLLRTYEFALVQQERMMAIERDKILGVMQSSDIALEFTKRAGLSIMTYMNLPAWFFKIDDAGQKEWAIKVGHIHEQALHLKNNYHDRILSQIEAHYPDLYQYVMQDQRPNQSFSIVLGQQFKQQTPILNLAALINEIQESYPHHLTWADDPERYQLIVNGLRAEVTERVLEMDKSHVRASAIQQRMLKALSGLAALDQHEVQWQGGKDMA